MDAARSSLTDRQFRAQPNMQLGPGTALADLVDVNHAIRWFLELTDRPHSEQLSEYLDGFRHRRYRDFHRPEPMNLVFGWHRTLFVRRAVGEILHQHQLLTFKILKEERSAAGALNDLPNVLGQRFQMVFPPFERCAIRDAEGRPGDHPITATARPDTGPIEDRQIRPRP